MFTNLYADAGADGAAGCAGGGMEPLLMIGVFYLFIIRPQQKKAKEHRNLIDNLKENDRVITASGIVGKVVSIKDDKGLIVLRVDDTTNTKITFQKSSIVTVLSKEDNDA